jgi:hypothetical protein
METNHRFHKLRPVNKGLAVALAVVLGLTALFSLSVASPARAADNTVKPDATIRVLNASPGAPALDVLLNGQPLVQNLAFGAPSSYASLKSGDYKVQVVPSGQAASNAIAEKDFTADSGQAYIVSIVNPLKDIKVNVDKVNLDAIDAGKARVRFIQDSPDAGKVDVKVTGGDTWFSGVDQGDATDYKNVDAGAYSLDVVGDNSTTLTTASGLQLEEGHVYDIFAIGQISDKSFGLIPLVTVVSPPCAAALNLQAQPTDGCVRIIHAAPGSPAVDVYVNGASSATNLAFGSSTEFFAVPAGDSTKIQITATGGSLDKAIVNDTVTINQGQAYQFIVTGNPDDVKLNESRLDLTPVATGQARLRLINASPDAGSVDLKIKDGDTLFSDAGFRDVTDYRVIDAGSTILDAVKNGESQVIAEGTIDLKEANVYDVILIGQEKDQSLKVIAIAAPASVRTGGVATPAAQGTPSPAATVESAATVSPTSEAMTTAQAGASVTATP